MSQDLQLVRVTKQTLEDQLLIEEKVLEQS